MSHGTILRLLKAAESASRERDYALATELAQRAQRLDPADEQILLFLGQIHGKNHEFSSAEQALDRAVSLSSKPVSTLIEAGNRACSFGCYQLGQRYYQSATEHKDATALAFSSLAEAMERLRRIDAALEMSERAISKDPQCGNAWLVRCRLLRHMGELNKAQSSLQAHIPAMEKTVKVRAWYELGTIFDRQGQYDKAMNAWLEAKTIMRPEAKAHATELQITRDRFRALRDSLSPEIIQKWLKFAQAYSPKQVALLAGHPRSGTTLLEQVLDAHPNIISAEETELFHDDAFIPLTRGLASDTALIDILEGASPERLETSRINYFARAEKFLRQTIGSRLLLDKNPSLTFLVPAFLRVFPEARFLIAVRDPRDVCLSCYMQYLPLNQASSAWLTLEGTVKEYNELMGIWLKMRWELSNSSIEVRYEDMVENLESVARSVLSFLNIPWSQCVLAFDEHARQKAVRSPTYSDVTKKVFKTAVGRWRNYQKYFEPHLAKLEPLVKALGYE